MRFNNRVTFIGEKTPPYYDWELGEEVEGEAVTYTLPCYASDLELEREKRVFGDYRAKRKVIYLQQSFNAPFVGVIVGGQKYRTVAIKQESKVFYLEVSSLETEL